MIIILMYICVCNAISERQLQEAIDGGARDLSALQADLGVASCCGQCAEIATEYLPGGRYAAPGLSAAAPLADVAAGAPLHATALRRVA